VVKVVFDAKVISYSSLLTTFWRCHNPTHKNRQGVDVGTQYRSAVFYQSDQQRTEAIASMAIQQLMHDECIVTMIEPLSNYCQAEPYHQQYFKKNPGAGCQI
jgi:peptide-methionine (S)-S-oxide reductase